MWIFKSNLSHEGFSSPENDYGKRYLSQLKKEYNEYRNTSVPEPAFSSFMKFSRDGDRLTYENEYFKKRTLLRDFALTAWIYKDKDALCALENVMWSICNEFTWVLPAHLGNDIFKTTIDLFAAETAQSLAEIMSLLYDYLSDEIKIRCNAEIYKRVLNPFLTRTQPYPWESMRNNWCAVCGGCIGMTALYLLEDYDAARTAADSLESVMESYIDSFSDDGACLEGLYYFNYGMTYFTAFIDLYKQRIGSDFNVNTEKVKKIARFAEKCCLDGGFTVSFSDGFERDRLYGGLSCKLSEMYGAERPNEEYLMLLEGDSCGRWCRAARDVAWTRGTNTEKSCNSCEVLPSAQWMILRSDEMCAAFKGGSNDEPHNHNDVGSFTVVKNSHLLLTDLGAGEYNSEYFSENRYTIFCNSSLGHSVPIINGWGQRSGSGFMAKTFKAEKNRATADISGAYDAPMLKKCERTLELNGGLLTISDKFSFNGKCTVTERFITRLDARQCGEKITLLDKGENVAVMKCENDCGISIKKHIHREHDGSKSEITIIDFNFSIDGEYVFLLKVQ